MMSRKRANRIGLSILFVGLFLSACGSVAPDPISESPGATSTPESELSNEEHNTVRTGELAPDFTLPDGEGNMVYLADVLDANRSVVLVFYHSYT